MKNQKLFSILAILFLITSCSITKKIEKRIIGKWEITSLNKVTDEFAEDENKGIFKELLRGSYIEFKVDKTYELNLMGKTFNKSWYISEDGSKILSPETERYFEIVSKTEETMVLKSFNRKDKVIIQLKRT